MNSPNQTPVNLDQRYRTLLILWFAICISVFMFLVLILLTPHQPRENQILTLLLNSLGIVPVGLSFLIKQRMLGKAIEAGRFDLLQSGYITAFALCEVAALLALLDAFSTGSKYYFVGFLVAGLGLLLHFPQKRHLADTEGYKKL
jgi:hypothetical protein